MQLNESKNERVPDDWLTSEDPNRRFLAAKAIIMNDCTRNKLTVGVLQTLPNDASLLGARARQALSKFRLNVKRHLDNSEKCSFEDRSNLVTEELRKAIGSITELESVEEIESWSTERKRNYCITLLKEFAGYARYRDRTPDAASILLRFGEVGLRAMLDGVNDEDSEVRLLSINCVAELIRTHFQDDLNEIADLLKHWDRAISIYAPGLLWRRGQMSFFAIPKLEACYDSGYIALAALSAKAVAIIDPRQRRRSLKVVEGLATDDLFWNNLIAELRGEQLYRGL